MKPAVTCILLLSLAACGRPPDSPKGPPPADLTAPAPPETPETPEECGPPEGLDVYRISGPYRHKNLTVFLLHRPGAPGGGTDCLTLEEGLRAGVVRVTEKGDGAEVGELEVENTGDRPVYFQAGDTVKGGQQDRSIAVDFVLPPKSGKKMIAAFCVEPGRWSPRGDVAGATAAALCFVAGGSLVATREQKLALRLEKDQGRVWEAGRTANRQLMVAACLELPREAPDSFVQAIEDPAVRQNVEEYLKALEGLPEGKPDAVGMVLGINGELSGAEIYSTPGLFRKLWPKLLRTGAVEALARSKDKGESAEIDPEAVRSLLQQVAGGKGRIESRPEGTTVKVFDREKAVLFDTEKDGRLLHRQIVVK